jgi:hypothetical protein
LQADEAGDVVRGVRIVVDQNGPGLAVEDVQDDAAARDAVILISVAFVDE